MNYLMVKREFETLSGDLAQMAETLVGPEPRAEPGKPPPGRSAKATEVVKEEINYVSAKLEALSILVENKQ